MTPPLHDDWLRSNHVQRILRFHRISLHTGIETSGKKYCTTNPIRYPSRAAPTAIAKNCVPERAGDFAAKRPLTKPTPKSTRPDSTIERYRAVRPVISR